MHTFFIGWLCHVGGRLSIRGFIHPFALCYRFSQRGIIFFFRW